MDALHPGHAYASERKHKYATLEHLLLGLIDDIDASAVMKACDFAWPAERASDELHRRRP
jgi:ATP-dependent Clp protease ATP-binding subunit ClpA